MRARLLKPVVATLKDVPSILETIPAGATVEFDLTVGLAEVLCDGKLYLAMLQDLLDAAHPMEWACASATLA